MKDDIYELTRQGKNICSCGKPKVMYYKPWCPLCEKNEVVTTRTITEVNYLKAMYTLEALGYKKEVEVLRENIEDSYVIINDSHLEFPIKYELEDSEDDEYTKALILLKETFNLGDDVTFWVSW